MKTSRVRARTLTLALAVSFAAAACSSGSAPKDTSTLYALATNVSTAHGTPAYATGHTGDKLKPGDAVRTDGTGHAELDWPDGSLTRLGPSTTAHISHLAHPDKRQVVVQLDVGQTWNRVERVTGTGRYEIDTPVGTAAVRGTKFAVTCTPDKTCLFQVVDGTVAVTPTGATTILVTAGQTLTVKRGVAPGAPGTVPALNADPFIAENEHLDTLPAAQRGTALAATTSTTSTTAPPPKPLIVVSGTPMRTVDPDTGAVKNLAVGGNDPSWSTDRQHVAYDRGGDVYVANADGTGERAVVTGPTKDTDPSWTPDGQYIVFARDNASIQKIAVAGGAPVQLSGTPPNPNGPGGLLEVGEPQVSPDGARVGFIVDYGHPQLYFVPIGGGSAQVGNTDIYGLDWSPDGKQVVTGTRGDLCTFGVYAADLASDQRRAVVAESCSDAEGPRWSPDGRRIAYWGDSPGAQPGTTPAGPSGIRVVNSDGTNNHLVLADDSGQPATIDW